MYGKCSRMLLSAATWVDGECLLERKLNRESRTITRLFVLKPGSKPTAVKSQGKKQPSPQILEDPEELPDSISGDSSTLGTLKQESSVSTCADPTDEDGDVAVAEVEEVRLEDPKVRSHALMSFCLYSCLS